MKKTVLATTFDLVRIASGHPMTLTTSDDEEVVVRLATPQEFLEMHVKALQSTGGGDHPMITLEQAENLVRPLPEAERI